MCALRGEEDVKGLMQRCKLNAEKMLRGE